MPIYSIILRDKIIPVVMKLNQKTFEKADLIILAGAVLDVAGITNEEIRKSALDTVNVRHHLQASQFSCGLFGVENSYACGISGSAHPQPEKGFRFTVAKLVDDELFQLTTLIAPEGRLINYRITRGTKKPLGGTSVIMTAVLSTLGKVLSVESRQELPKGAIVDIDKLVAGLIAANPDDIDLDDYLKKDVSKME